MRALFGIVGLVVVVLVAGTLAKKQFSGGMAPPAQDTAGQASAPAGSPREQVQQYQQAVQEAMQMPARSMPDEDK